MPESTVKVVNRQDMLSIEEKTFGQFKVSEELIIENVGAEAALFLIQRYHLSPGDVIVFLCGKGNNAADGLCLARHLHTLGMSVELHLLFSESQFSMSAKTQCERMRLMSDEQVIFHTNNEFPIPLLTKKSRLVVDCIFGTGLTRPLDDIWSNYFRQLESATQNVNVPIVAMDMPSGALTDTLVKKNKVLCAQLTLMIGALKLGPFLSEGVFALGELHHLQAGFPRQLTHSKDTARMRWSAKFLKDPSEQGTGHKYDKGHVLIIGGSKGLTGAPILSAMAAQRCGAGLITVGHPSQSSDEINQRTPADIMLKAFAGNDDVITGLEKINSVLLGPGFGRTDDSVTLFNSVIQQLQIYKGPKNIVIDADGLFHFAAWIKAYGVQTMGGGQDNPWVLTPHTGEWLRLLEYMPGDWRKEWDTRPLETLRKFVSALNVNVVLKNSAATVVASPDAPPQFHYATCHNLATAGSGDILAGMIAAQLGLYRQKSSREANAISEILVNCVRWHAHAGQEIPWQGQGALAILDQLTLKSTRR